MAGAIQDHDRGADRRRDDVRQGPRADDHAAAQRARLRPGPHHGALLHAVRALDPARLRVDGARGVLRAPRPQGLRAGQRASRSSPTPGRKVYGGDGITPDYCVEAETRCEVRLAPHRAAGLHRLLPQLRRRRRRPAEAQIAGTGSPPADRVGEGQASSAGTSRSTTRCSPTSGAYLDAHKITLHRRPTSTQNRDAVARQIDRAGPVAGLRRGRGAEAQRGLGPPDTKALELIPRAEHASARTPEVRRRAGASTARSPTAAARSRLRRPADDGPVPRYTRRFALAVEERHHARACCIHAHSTSSPRESASTT